jgi:hypothetical protein
VITVRQKLSRRWHGPHQFGTYLCKKARNKKAVTTK